MYPSVIYSRRGTAVKSMLNKSPRKLKPCDVRVVVSNSVPTREPLLLRLLSPFHRACMVVVKSAGKGRPSLNPCVTMKCSGTKQSSLSN